MELETRPEAAIGGGAAGDPDRASLARPPAIEVRGIEKSFRIPTQQVSRLKERMVRPWARQEYRRLEALRDVDFDVGEGEFFGIVGRNGSGKSTLLKILASIYRADAGSVRMAGSLAPFIELGVGFDMELSARDNVVLNGVMMGLTPKQARQRLDAVFEFAELAEFAEVKLKNFSSGMLVRLGFSVMIEADTDILLIDEVLAVGDAAFQQKCADVFHEMRDAGKTIVLVTHDMTAVERYCHRALLLSDGEVVEVGDPGEVARRYLQLNFEHGFVSARGEPADQDGDVRLLDVWAESKDGERITNIEHGSPVRLRATVEARAELPDPRFNFVVATEEDVYVHELRGSLFESGDSAGLHPGQRVTFSVALDIRLSPQRYFVHLGIGRRRGTDRVDSVLWIPLALELHVFGSRPSLAVVVPEYRVEATREPES